MHRKLIVKDIEQLENTSVAGILLAGEAVGQQVALLETKGCCTGACVDSNGVPALTMCLFTGDPGAVPPIQCCVDSNTAAGGV